MKIQISEPVVTLPLSEYERLKKNVSVLDSKIKPIYEMVYKEVYKSLFKRFHWEGFSQGTHCAIEAHLMAEDDARKITNEVMKLLNLD